MENALKKEASLVHGESIDNYMDIESCEAAMKKIDRKKVRQIAALDMRDPQYSEKVVEIVKRAR